MVITVGEIKKLRDSTGAGIADCKEALSKAEGNIDKARDWISKKGLDRASSKSDREVKTGLVETYSHAGKIGVMVEILCETDFVAKTPDFKNLAHEIALQIASMKPDSVESLLNQDYIRDPSLKVSDLINEVIGRIGENIQIGRFERIALGE